MSPHFLVLIICPMDLAGAVENADGIRQPKEIDTDQVMVNISILAWSIFDLAPLYLLPTLI